MPRHTLPKTFMTVDPGLAGWPLHENPLDGIRRDMARIAGRLYDADTKNQIWALIRMAAEEAARQGVCVEVSYQHDGTPIKILAGHADAINDNGRDTEGE